MTRDGAETFSSGGSGDADQFLIEERLVLQVPSRTELSGRLDETYRRGRRYERRALGKRRREARFEFATLLWFGRIGGAACFVSTKLLRQRRLSVPWLRSVNALLPVLRRVDALSRVTGLSLLACAEKHWTRLREWK